ncbi:uncharacterized protein LOC141626551 [Silene latifolia]|uniref:uncharacterized protein LOC141626551 n=1 Tax=Silene latifolia TaxID=37657 RepID=UPI003D77F1B4
MATISKDKIFLKHFVVAHGNGEFKEDDWSLFSSFLPMEETHLIKVKFLKERGNDFFKQNLFDSAGGCYEMACRLLCLVLESMEDYDVESVSQLAISLNLNLAACANKLHEYEAAINFCSLVLSSYPKNAKALFRRVVACMKTNMLMEAQTDLETASMLEPKNKDILRELNVVKNLLAINHNGKRSIEDQLLCEVVRECKRPIPNDNTEDTTVNDKEGSSCGSCVTPLSNSTIMHTCISDDGLLINLEENSSPNFDLEHNHKYSQMGDNEHTPKNSVLEFSRKGGGNSRLRISGQAYQKMLQGSKVSFYNKRDLSTMTIRILNTKVTKEGGITRDHYKRKKRRRRSKKRKPKMVVGNEDTGSCSGAINGIHGINSRGSSIGGVNSSSLSICDILSLSGTHIRQGDPAVVAPNFCLSVSLTNDTANTSISFQAHKDPNEHQSFFLFSARPKKCKFHLFGKLSRASPTRRLCRYPSGTLLKPN